MADYTLQDMDIQVPELFHDCTMNLFTLSETGTSDFTFVVTRAAARHEDELSQVAERLLKELSSSLTDFALISRKDVMIDAIKGHELSYQFSASGKVLTQKQTVVLIVNGADKRMVGLTGTSMTRFGTGHARIYADIIGSIRFREGNNRHPAGCGEPVSVGSESLFFCYDQRNKFLTLHSGLSALYQETELRRALKGEYLFFDSKGYRLTMAAVNDDATHGKRYGLWTTVPPSGQDIFPCLFLAKVIQGTTELNDAEAIECWLLAQRDAQ